MEEEWKIKIWLIPTPLMLLVGILIGLGIFGENMIGLIVSMSVGTLLMFPFMWKYSNLSEEINHE